MIPEENIYIKSKRLIEEVRQRAITTNTPIITDAQDNSDYDWIFDFFENDEQHKVLTRRKDILNKL